MENKYNQCFKINESYEMTKQKILNSIKELRKYHKKDRLDAGQIEKPEEENTILKNQNPHEETMEIVENILQSNHEIKEEPSDYYYDLTQKYSNCELCGNTFSDEDDLKLHIKVKHGKIYHKCESCHNIFSDEEDLELHMTAKHGKTSKITRRETLINDPLMENNDDYDIEDFLVKKHTSKYKIHQSETQPGQNIHQNMSNGENFNESELDAQNNETSSNTEQLSKNVHEGVKKRNYLSTVCEICNQTFSRATHLRTHIQAVHQRQKDHQCDSCNQTFSRSTNLRTHIQSVHQRQKDHKCGICDEKFAALQTLRSHIETVHEGRKDHKCGNCSKAFSSKKHLSLHFKVIHLNEKKYRCNHCNKLFVTNFHMNRHRKVHK